MEFNEFSREAEYQLHFIVVSSFIGLELYYFKNFPKIRFS